MKAHEAQRRILEVLVTVGNAEFVSDTEIARELQLDIRFVQDNLALLEQIGDIEAIKYFGDGDSTMMAAITSLGRTLLREPDYEQHKWTDTLLPTPKDTQKALKAARRIKSILDEQLAGYGSLLAPPHLIYQQEEKEREIAELEALLRDQRDSA